MKPSTFARLLIVPFAAVAIVMSAAVSAHADADRGRGPGPRADQSQKAEPSGAISVVVALGLVVGLVARQWRRPRG